MLIFTHNSKKIESQSFLKGSVVSKLAENKKYLLHCQNELVLIGTVLKTNPKEPKK